MLHLLPRSQPPGLGPELPQAPLLALAQATYFEDVKLTVSLTNLIPQAFIKSIYCMLGIVPGAGELKRMDTPPQGSKIQAPTGVATEGQTGLHHGQLIKNRHLQCAFSNGLKSTTAGPGGEDGSAGKSVCCAV